MHLDNLISSLVHYYDNFLHKRAMQLESLSGRLHKLSPIQQFIYQQQWTREITRRLHSMIQLQLKKKRNRLSTATALLEAISPRGVLARGYAIVRSSPHEKPAGELIRTTRQVQIGKKLEVILQEGLLGCEVTEINGDGR